MTICARPRFNRQDLSPFAVSAMSGALTRMREVIVNERGHATNVSVISPLGYGLDQRAVAAVRRWEFSPGLKDGNPVKTVTLVEVEFRFPGTWFDDKNEKRRSAFNVAITNIARSRQTEDAVKTLEELSRQKYLPAMHVL